MLVTGLNDQGQKYYVIPKFSLIKVKLHWGRTVYTQTNRRGFYQRLACITKFLLEHT